MNYKELILKQNELKNELKIIKDSINKFESKVKEQMITNNVLKTEKDGIVFEIKESITFNKNNKEAIDFIEKNNEIVNYLEINKSVKVSELKKNYKDIYDKFSEKTIKLKIDIKEEVE